MLSHPCAVFDRCLSDFAVFVFACFAVPLSAVWSQPVFGKVILWLGLSAPSAVFMFHDFLSSISLASSLSDCETQSGRVAV